jgi:Uncharacterized protein conserved in bacteria
MVFFDGEYFLCNRLARFILHRSDKLTAVSLQSEFAKTVFRQDYDWIKSLNTLILLENNRLYIKSDAVLRIFRMMGGLWPVLGSFGWIPLPVRDKLYDVIARNRRRWFSNYCLTQPIHQR